MHMLQLCSAIRECLHHHSKQGREYEQEMTQAYFLQQPCSTASICSTALLTLLMTLSHDLADMMM